MERLSSKIQPMDSSRTNSKSIVTNECAVTTSSLMLFVFQMFIISIVVIMSIYNLTCNVGDTNMWTALLSSSIGYILPNPKIKFTDETKKQHHNN